MVHDSRPFAQPLRQPDNQEQPKSLIAQTLGMKFTGQVPNKEIAPAKRIQHATYCFKIEHPKRREPAPSAKRALYPGHEARAQRRVRPERDQPLSCLWGQFPAIGLHC